MKVFFVKYNDPINVLCCISGLIFSEERDEGVLCEVQ